MFARDDKDGVTIYGRQNWESLVLCAGKAANDAQARRLMADALAAMVAEVTPLHRAVLAPKYATSGAQGRMGTYPLPPGLVGADAAARERWAALVFLDCVDYAADVLSKDHSLVERQGWRAAAEAYTNGAERRGRSS